MCKKYVYNFDVATLTTYSAFSELWLIIIILNVEQTDWHLTDNIQLVTHQSTITQKAVKELYKKLQLHVMQVNLNVFNTFY